MLASTYMCQSFCFVLRAVMAIDSFSQHMSLQVEGLFLWLIDGYN
jgi:hypothetical protein